MVDDDVGIRRLIRTGLELEGFTVIEAATLSQARSVHTERVDGVVLDRQLPDGDGLMAYEEFRTRYADAIVVMHSSSHVPSGYPSVPKGDIDGMVELFGMVLAPEPRLERAPEVALAVADRVVDEWIELCRWDPELPADNRPPIPGSVVTAVAGPIAFVALAAPQLAKRLVGGAGLPLGQSALTGAVLLLVADQLAQHALPQQVPVGIVTVVVGGGYLVALLLRGVGARR